MSRLRWMTAGESHGPRLTALVEGVPSGLPLLAEDIDGDLARRQRGYGQREEHGSHLSHPPAARSSGSGHPSVGVDNRSFDG